MVEANPEIEDQEQEQEEQKTFIDEPAILDKFKAAAVITDGKLQTLQSKFSPTMELQIHILIPFLFLSFSVLGQGFGACYPRS